MLQAILERTGAQNGDLIFFGADRAKVVNDALGALRAKVGHERGLAEAGWRPLWVVDFPMFEYDEEAKRWAARAPSVHRAQGRPRGAPRHRSRQGARQGLRHGAERLGDRRRLGADPPRRKCRRRCSRRSASAPRTQRTKFGFLLDALQYGAPPHGGIAFGLDRIVDADGGRRVDPRRDRVPEDAARPGPADRRADAGRPSSSCANCTSE